MTGPEGRTRALPLESELCMSKTCTGWRGARAARSSPDGVRIRQAVACPLPTGPDTGRARDGWHRPARAGPCVGDAGTPGHKMFTPAPHPQDGPPQARFHLDPGCRPALAHTRGRGLSGGWLGRASRHGHPLGASHCGHPAASGTRRCTASSVVVPHVTAPPGGLPPAWADTFSGPSVSGGNRSMAWGRKVGIKWRCILGKRLELLGRGPGFVHALGGMPNGIPSFPLRAKEGPLRGSRD